MTPGVPAVLLANHGVLVFHRTPDLAVLVGGIVEEAAQAGLNAGTIGGPVEIPEDLPRRHVAACDAIRERERRDPRQRIDREYGLTGSCHDANERQEWLSLVRANTGAAMPEMTRYENGVPSWVDMGVHDLGTASRFYAELFGWDVQDLGEEAGHYSIASKDGKQVAALSPAQDPGPPRWTTYVNVDDVDAAAKNVEAAGGTVVVPPMDVMSRGAWRFSKTPPGHSSPPGSHRITSERSS